MKKIFWLLLLWPFHQALSQDSLAILSSIPQQDTLITNFLPDSTFAQKPSSGLNKKRVYTVAAIDAAVLVGTGISLYNTWYSSYPQSDFHFFNDNGEWLQVDKFGHSYTCYTLSRLSAESWRWAGLSQRQSTWIGAASGMAYQTIVEVMDGFSANWGFSWGDYVANTAGAALFVGQQLVWGEQRISYKFSFHKIDYGSQELNDRADDIFGSTTRERMLKDYNSQTYWLSANLKSFFKHSNLPKWLNVAVGYGANNMFGAYYNSWTDPSNGHVINHEQDMPRYRQFYIAPDVDFTKIKTKSKLLKTTFSILNCLKFPAPSIEFSQGKVKWNWLTF
ncbi:DUF2279 domain-containing protein [Danxiaibacter flavus]|uniref:DUF2279 domain-containing protein n=1 Tax=Danxiaibacter flavus TaxID=3049108 RepID=A0ABV3Z8P6_9BACT|nr:DUF2279 domain-containing protein [Chitinophagaceae bacterium DXS]